MVANQDGPVNINASREVLDAERNLPTAERDGHHVPKIDAFGYSIREQPFGTKPEASSRAYGRPALQTLNFLKKAEEEMSSLEICVYEKNSDVGGTWLENRYPGCACDIPSVNYQFSWKNQIVDALLFVLSRNLAVP